MREIYLTIEGDPGQEVQVWYRGDQSADMEDPAPIIFTGLLGEDGRITVRVPRAYLCIGYPVRRGCQPHRLDEADGDSVTVRLAADPDEGIREPIGHDAEAQQEANEASDETFDFDIPEDGVMPPAAALA